ncbi:MAG TPA: DUF4190 domain-containing protein [Candidatus Acidoferrales bacterium]|jgi:hypothetical protein|nr:DUF4190 domain-containing protein [Candidatus Acidoferrales bacterium]
MYKIVGADGRQYGPVNEDQIRRWIAEGRANAQTQALAEGAMQWKPLATFPEFAAAFGQQVPPPIRAVTGSHLRATNSFATWGMILGIVALVCCCFKVLLATLGLIFSLIGLSQINARPDLYEGRGFAIAGIVLCGISLLIVVLMALFWLTAGTIHPYHPWPVRRFY